jgi:hypothetical protein
MHFRDGAQWSHIVSFIKLDECDRLAQEQLAFASGTPIRQAMSPRYPREALNPLALVDSEGPFTRN